MRSRFLGPLVIAGVLLAAPAAPAATLSVDDDGQDCPAAPFASIQAAIDAAAPGDTVAICPGAYVEGPGGPGTNALTITRSVTLKGAGADLVRISPRRTTATGGQIAAAAHDIRDGAGDIVSVIGGTGVPITVHISGVTVDGNGVFVEAGVVYLDAQGSITRSRITNVVTSEAADAYATTPGAWRGPQPGYGVAQVTAATAAPAGAAPRTLLLDNNRIDRYNRAGVVVSGLASGADAAVANRLTLNASEVVGRILCQNFAANGNCSAPGLVTTGPLFGQDGVRATDRARVTVMASQITSNLTNGTNAPVRQTFNASGTQTNPGTAGNENLPLSAGIRLVGADASGSLITRNNIIDNGYGVYNAEADGTTASATPVDAPNNWWGVRFTPPPANNGPAISPSYNPPVPENPVNGSPVTTDAGTTSTAVDFLPYRSGPQSDPATGQFPNIQAPMPVGDAAPTAGLTVDDATADRGQTITLTATAGDDFGVKRITFYDGSTVIGSVRTPPYTLAYAVPADAECAERTLTALVEDSSGQTAAATTTITVVGPNECKPVTPPGGGGGGGENPPGPPTASLPPGLGSIAQGGTTVAIAPASAAGIAKVEWFLGERLVCTVSVAPFTCRVVPRAEEVGLQSLRVVVTDRLGQSTVLTRQVLVRPFRSRGVRITVGYAKARGGKVRRTITARVLMPTGVTSAEGCRSSRITLVVTRRYRPYSNTQPSLDRNCSARLRLTSRRAKRRIYAVSARFGGNTVLLPATSSRRFK